MGERDHQEVALHLAAVATAQEHGLSLGADGDDGRGPRRRGRGEERAAEQPRGGGRRGLVAAPRPAAIRLSTPTGRAARAVRAPRTTSTSSASSVAAGGTPAGRAPPGADADGPPGAGGVGTARSDTGRDPVTTAAAGRGAAAPADGAGGGATAGRAPAGSSRGGGGIVWRAAGGDARESDTVAGESGGAEAGPKDRGGVGRFCGGDGARGGTGRASGPSWTRALRTRSTSVRMAVAAGPAGAPDASGVGLLLDRAEARVDVAHELAERLGQLDVRADRAVEELLRDGADLRPDLAGVGGLGAARLGDHDPRVRPRGLRRDRLDRPESVAPFAAAPRRPRPRSRARPPGRGPSP